MLEGLVDIYLPDLKYASGELSTEFSHAADYFEKAKLALDEMYRQVGRPVFDTPSVPPSAPPNVPLPSQLSGQPSAAHAASVYPSDTPLLRRGMIVRHLVLPGQVGDSKKILHYLRDTYRDNIYVSVMQQYTPLPQVAHIPGLNRRVTEAEYQRVVDFCLRLGMENVYIQEGDTARESFIPPFDFTGL